MEIFNFFDPKLQMINTKSVIKNKLKDLLDKLKKSKVQTILVLEYKKVDDHKSLRKIFNSCAKPIFDDSDFDKVLESMYQSIMTKTKNYISKDWIVKLIVGHCAKISRCYYRLK